MNDHDWKDDTQLDRLADGELSPEEYRQLLQALEREPDGWRRAALAFLEAQAFDQGFSSLRRGIEPLAKVETVPSLRSAQVRGVTRFALALAASFLVAFGLGAWWRNNVVNVETSSASSVVKEDPNSRAGNPSSGAGTELAQQVGPAEKTLPPRRDPQEQLTFVVDRGDGQSEQFNVPVYDKDDAYARWLIEQPAVPIEVERDIRRAGYRVERLRQWAPVRLRDGRRAVFPVDELQITPVSKRTY